MRACAVNMCLVVTRSMTRPMCTTNAPVPGDLASEGLDARAPPGYLLQSLLQLGRRRRHRQLLCKCRERM